MIHLFFYLCVGLFLILTQTTASPYLPIPENSYDLTAICIFYLGIYRPFSEGISVIMVLGFIMDSISGTPFGLYITIYFWLYLGIKWLLQYLHGGSLITLPLVVALGILVENIFIMSTSAVMFPDWTLSMYIVRKIAYQVLFAACTAPLIIMLIKTVHLRLAGMIYGFYDKENGQD